MENQDFYANTNSRHYLRVNGVYFQRIDGVGWGKCPESDLPDERKFAPLHDLQRAAYFPALRELGLID